MDAYFTTIYFVDPQLICGGGRTQEMFDSQGTGDRLLIQVTRIHRSLSLRLTLLGRLVRKPLTAS